MPCRLLQPNLFLSHTVPRRVGSHVSGVNRGFLTRLRQPLFTTMVLFWECHRIAAGAGLWWAWSLCQQVARQHPLQPSHMWCNTAWAFCLHRIPSLRTATDCLASDMVTFSPQTKLSSSMFQIRKVPRTIRHQCSKDALESCAQQGHLKLWHRLQGLFPDVVLSPPSSRSPYPWQSIEHERVYQAVSSFITSHIDGPATLVISLSGGVDSMVLSHCLQAFSLQRQLRLHAVHIDYGLRLPASNREAEFVAAWAQEASIPLDIFRLNCSGNRLTVEACSRQARYRAYQELVAKTWHKLFCLDITGMTRLRMCCAT